MLEYRRRGIYNYSIKGTCCLFKNKIILWMTTIHYPKTIRSHLVTIVSMAPFTPKCTSKLRSALHFRYSIVIPHFIPRARILLNPNTHEIRLSTFKHGRLLLKACNYWQYFITTASDIIVLCRGVPSIWQG